MATVIEELLMEIGVDVDDKSIEQFNKITETTIKTLKRVTIVAGAAGAAIVAYTVKMAGATDANAKFTHENGLTFASLQELGFAAEREGASMDSLKSSLNGLTLAAGQASMGAGGGIEAFARLGINIMDVNGQIKTADKLMLEVSDSMQGLQRAEQVDLISKLGISQDMLLLLQRGTQNIEMLRGEARRYGIESERMKKSGEDFQDVITNLKQVIFGALIPLRQFVLDLANNLIPKITEWIAKNRKLIKGKFVEYLQLIIKSFKSLMKIVKKFMPLFKGMAVAFVAFKTLNFAKSIFMIGKAMWLLVPAVTAATGGLNLIIPIIALIVGAIVLFLEKTGLMKQLINDLKPILKDLIDIFKELWEILKEELSPILKDLFGIELENAIKTIESLIKSLSSSIKNITSGILKTLKLARLLRKGQKIISADTPEEKTKERVGLIAEIATGFIGDFIRNKISTPALSTTPTPRASTTGGGNTSNTSSINATIEISSASGDPNAIGKAVKDALTAVARNGLENQTVTVLA